MPTVDKNNPIHRAIIPKIATGLLKFGVLENMEHLLSVLFIIVKRLKGQLL